MAEDEREDKPEPDHEPVGAPEPFLPTRPITPAPIQEPPIKMPVLPQPDDLEEI